jgi:Concanavalin A-like lectin/glucanases superfamily
MKTSPKYFLAALFISLLIIVTGCNDTENPSSPNAAQTDVGYSSLQKSGTIASGVVSWWPGDGNANDIIDGNNGALQNGATYAPGKVGEAFSLDGVDDYAEVPDAANLDIVDEITIDAWIYPNTVNSVTGNRIVDKNTGGLNDGYLLDIVRTKLRLIASGDDAQSIQSIPVNTWTHVAGTYDGANIKLYINGVLDNTVVTTGPIPTNNLSLLIGETHPIPNSFDVKFDGMIDEVEIYNRALSASEIQTIFEAGNAGQKPKKLVTICHKPGTPAQKTLVIPYQALSGHLGHGDTIGSCQ